MQTESASNNSHDNTSAQSNLSTNQTHHSLRITKAGALLLLVTSVFAIAAAPPITPPAKSPPTKSPPAQSPPTNTINNTPEFRIASANLSGNSPEQAAFARNTRSNSRAGSRIVSWTDSRCNNCHIPDSLFSHPVGVTPTRPLPSSFPLINGKIECITCHADNNASDHARARNEKTQLLRGNRTGDAFCAQCHQPSGNQRRDMHAFAVGLAHLSWNDDTQMPGTFGSDFAYARTQGVERENCLSCHDGLIASDAAHTEYASTGRIGGTLGVGHPINTPYRISNPGDSDVTLRPEQMLDKRIRLFNGQVQCASCHSLFSQRKNLLVMSNYGSNLCLNCHQF